ncbi:hypothetical protein BGW38_006984, partial [Lunasporangiospora selenospora]
EYEDDLGLGAFLPEAYCGPVEETASGSSNSSEVLLDKDWKQECRARIISERNWSKGRIQSLFTLRVHQSSISRLRIKHGKLLSADMFGRVAVWDTQTFECEFYIDTIMGPVQLLDFGASSMIMTVVSRSGICRIWDLKTREQLNSTSDFDIVCMTMSDDYLLLGLKSGQIHVVDFMTGQVLRSTAPLSFETVHDIFIQNNTMIVATSHNIHITSIDTLEEYHRCPLPIPQSIPTFCSVFHIRSLVLLMDGQLVHVEWQPLYKSSNKNFYIDTQLELPPDLTQPPTIHRTKVPPIQTITSIAIGGVHPHVLTTNADRTSLDDTIRVCPTIRKNRGGQSRRASSEVMDNIVLPHATDDTLSNLYHGADIALSAGGDGTVVAAIGNTGEEEDVEAKDTGVTLTSENEYISEYLRSCGLRPSFMDVDEDVVVIGTNKGDIVVLGMFPQD